MAVDTATNVSQRRVVYGVNVLVQVVLVVLVVVGAVYLAQDKGQVDLTRAGVNSVSPRTKMLLRNLDQDVTITAIYTVLSEYDELAQKRQDNVGDLLGLYESAGRGHVTANLIDPMKDRARLPALLKGLREKSAYRDEASAHEAALTEFPELNRRIQTLIDEQLQGIQRLFDADASLQESALTEIMRELNRLLGQCKQVSASVQELLGYDIPHYGGAVEVVRGHLEAIERWATAVGEWVQSKAELDQTLTPDALAFIRGVSGEYQALLPDVQALLTRTSELKRVELEDLSDQLNRWASAPPILVETSERALVLPFNEVWPHRGDRRGPPPPDGDNREFAGERAISSAILKLTQTEKTALVFTRFGGPSPIMPDFSQMNRMTREMPQAPFGVLNNLLTKENFITQDWDVKTQKTPPEIEDAARTVYIVFPPTPPPQPDPRRPSPEPGITPDDVQLILDAVKGSGMAIFLTGSSERATGGSGVYEFADYLKSDWGIGVEHQYLVLRFQPSPEDPALFVPRRTPLIIDTADSGPRARLTSHPIAEPLRALAAAFVAVCPLEILSGDERPEGVTVDEVAVIDATTDMWAIRDIMQVEGELKNQRGTTPHDEDLRPPFPIALAAENPEGQRIVLFASTSFATNPIVEAPGGYAFTGAGLVAYPAYPANPDLFINAVHWLTKEADRISVGARRSEVPRLDKLKEGFWMDFWRVFLVGIWPGLALLVGGGVWFFRRR